MTGRLYVDPGRCIGCRACEHACSECPDHAGHSMIHLDVFDRATSVQTAPTVCMHCAEPACAAVCPADAIKIDAEGIVLTAAAERCIGCGSCALACPFGVPKIDAERELMTKCDLCYHRTSVGDAPMCATVCPSGALFFCTPEEALDQRRARPLDVFHFDDRVVRTRNLIMAPAGIDAILVGDGAGTVRSRAEQHLEEAIW